MGTFNDGYKNIKVKLINFAGDDFAKQVYEFGRFAHYFESLSPVEQYDGGKICTALIDEIIAGRALPKYAMLGTRIEFSVENISRICLAQLTRDNAIFCSESTGFRPLTQNFNMPLSICQYDDIMDKVKKAQKLLEEAYIAACEREIPAQEARYIGLHCQTISLNCSFTVIDFAKYCHSRTSHNFCDECNYVYRLMYSELKNAIQNVTEKNSYKLWKWLINDDKCINDKLYFREFVYNSDFNYSEVKAMTPDARKRNFPHHATYDWRKSGWKMEIERIMLDNPELLTNKEYENCLMWIVDKADGQTLLSTYDGTQPDVLKNMIKEMPYYEK